MNKNRKFERIAISSTTLKDSRIKLKDIILVKIVDFKLFRANEPKYV